MPAITGKCISSSSVIKAGPHLILVPRQIKTCSKAANEEGRLLACNGCDMLLTWCGANVQDDPCLQPELTIIRSWFTSTVWQHATLIEALIRRRAYWPAARHDGRLGHTNHSCPATYWPGGRCDGGSEGGILCSSDAFRPVLNHVNMYLKGTASILQDFAALSRGWGPGVLQTDVYDNWWRHPEGWPVNGSGASTLFCLSVSLHRHIGKTNGV